mgnify:CR=1 FL=1
MSIDVNGSNAVSLTTETLLEAKTANLAKSQTELEGQMALNLIASAAVDNVSLPTVGNSGLNVNIKV